MVFECEIQPRLRDLNLAAHVDNVEALRILDEARLMFLRYADLGEGTGGLFASVPEGVGDLVAGQRVDYRAEMRFASPRPYLVRLWVSRIGRSSFTLSSELRVAADHEPAIVANTALVMFDAVAQRAWPLDVALVARLREHVGEPVQLREV